MCVSVCLSVGLSLACFKNKMSKFQEDITCGRGLVLLKRQSNTLCTSGFLDNDTFSHNGAHNFSAELVLDERPVTPCMNDIDSPAAGNKQFDWWHGGRRNYGAGRNLPSPTALFTNAIQLGFV